MALSTFVYISDVENLSDARYAAGMGVDLVGFRLNPHDEHALDPAQFKEISEWISGVKIVGEFGNASPQMVAELLPQFAVDYLLIEDASQVRDFERLYKPIILRISMTEGNDRDLGATLNYCSGLVEYFLLESDQKGLKTHDTELIQTYARQFPLLLGYGVTLENANEIVPALQLKGISLKGAAEIRPGYKDFDEMADILEALEID